MGQSKNVKYENCKNEKQPFSFKEVNWREYKKEEKLRRIFLKSNV